MMTDQEFANDLALSVPGYPRFDVKKHPPELHVGWDECLEARALSLRFRGAPSSTHILADLSPLDAKDSIIVVGTELIKDENVRRIVADTLSTYLAFGDPRKTLYPPDAARTPRNRPRAHR